MSDEKEPEKKEKEWYTARQASEYLGIPMHRLAKLRRDGRIKSTLDDSFLREAHYHISQLQSVDTRDLRKKPTEEKAELDVIKPRRKRAKRVKEEDLDGDIANSPSVTLRKTYFPKRLLLVGATIAVGA